MGLNHRKTGICARNRILPIVVESRAALIFLGRRFGSSSNLLVATFCQPFYDQDATRDASLTKKQGLGKLEGLVKLVGTAQSNDLGRMKIFKIQQALAATDDINRMNRKSRISLKSMALTIGLVALSGCNQQRYEPAQWRAASRDSTTMPDNSRDESGRTGVNQWLGSTLPGRGSTLPGRIWTTLPQRDWTTMPSRGTTLPYRGTTLPRGNEWNGNRFQMSTLPRRGTTLPEPRWSRTQIPRGSTLPGR